jgi:Leucine-rich repeat (LRR) protein
MTAIHISVQKIPIDMLYINNSTLTAIPGGVFKNLDVLNLHISNSKIETISNDAFVGLEDKLITLTLQNTFLQLLPHLQIQTLRALKTLDLSNNKLKSLPDNSFVNMQLSTIKLSDNDITISDGAFRGLESTLKNLNLKGTNLKTIPKAIQNLSSLAFLDLAQNKIQDIEPDFLINLHSLTAINLERNQIRRLHERVFIGINDSLSSLSLLNNLLVDFPSEAISKLTGLRVSTERF